MAVMDDSRCRGFLSLIRMGIGQAVPQSLDDIDWLFVIQQAKLQGLYAIVYDGIEQLPSTLRPPLTTWLQWIGEVQLEETRYKQQWDEACKMAHLFHLNGIRTYVLKGNVVSECYPKPEHRCSCDFDCFLLSEEGDEDVWENGNKIIEEDGFKVDRRFYKNSKYSFYCLTVENHRYLVPFRGNKTLRRLEQYLQSELRSFEPNPSDFFHQTSLCRPPVMVSALFLIEHAYSHFLHEGLTWRHVLDWVMFSRKHKNEIDWYVLDALIDEFGFRKFYDAYVLMGKYLMGESQDSSFTIQEKRMLADIWAPLDLHKTVRGFKCKLALAGNTLRARWKYHYFSEISMLHALWIQVVGYLFNRTPQLN